METISRQDAIKKGLSYYFTGVPCKHGHVAKRHVKACVCVECLAIWRKSDKGKRWKKEYNRKPGVKEKSRVQAKAYHAENRESCLEKMKVRNKKYYILNREQIIKSACEYQKENSTERTKYKKEWSKKRAAEDPVYKMSLVCRRMLHRALGVAGQKKYKRTHEYLPYTYQQLVSHLESGFKKGMSWDNYGEWHIDHIKPISWFAKNKIMDIEKINALDNLQPLWAKENFKKGKKSFSELNI